MQIWSISGQENEIAYFPKYLIIINHSAGNAKCVYFGVFILTSYQAEFQKSLSFHSDWVAAENIDEH